MHRKHKILGFQTLSTHWWQFCLSFWKHNILTKSCFTTEGQFVKPFQMFYCQPQWWSTSSSHANFLWDCGTGNLVNKDISLCFLTFLHNLVTCFICAVLSQLVANLYLCKNALCAKKKSPRNSHLTQKYVWNNFKRHSKAFPKKSKLKRSYTCKICR